jgi:SsrA-binding protein
MSEIKIISQNKKAYHDYFIEDTFEAGIVLLGTEVKALRDGQTSLGDSYAVIQQTEIFFQNCHISHFSPAHQFNHDPLRKRKLLLHKKEIEKLIGKTREKGYSLIPLKLYFKDGKAKLELALAKGKRQYDKRQAIRKKESDREIARAASEKN